MSANAGRHVAAAAAVPATAVVTGAASGIGLAAARALAATGTRLVLADRDLARLEEAIPDLADAVRTHVDVADLDSVRALADAAIGTLGPIDLVFANAGVALSAPVAATTHAEWQWVLGVNLWGAIHTTEAFLPWLLECGTPAHVVFTASFAGLVANQGLGAYTVSKFGVVALAEVLHRELRDTPVDVSVLCPMRVDTPIGATSARHRPAAASPSTERSAVPAGAGGERDRQGGVIGTAEVVAALLEAYRDKPLYVMTHAEARAPIRRRAERLDAAFDRPASTATSRR